MKANRTRITVALAATVALVALITFFAARNSPGTAAAAPLSPVARQFDENRAYAYLNQICDLGPRPTGSPAMQQQQELLAAHFQSLGGKVGWQRFRMRHPQNGQPVPVTNLLVEWHPDRDRRILLCAHYDTKPFPTEDPVNPRGTFIGANDGASGVALLMELAHHIQSLDTRWGVDFVLFDAEEFVFNERDAYFLGSQGFARKYVAEPPPFRYDAAVLVDMVGDADLQLYYEGKSYSWRDTRPIVRDIWNTAQRLGIHEFIEKTKHTVRDDHLMLHTEARIPACDIIDFDYPYWHTEADTPDKCSGASLRKVGVVLMEWLQSSRPRRR